MMKCSNNNINIRYDNVNDDNNNSVQMHNVLYGC